MSKDLMNFNKFWNNIPDIFDNDPFFRPLSRDFSKIFNGKCDFEETNDSYKIQLEVPGVKKDEINISLKNDRLTIHWKRDKEEQESNEKKTKKIIYERSHGSFTRSFEVEGADPEKINAELKNGVLNITLPKKENSKPKVIQIH